VERQLEERLEESSVASLVVEDIQAQVSTEDMWWVESQPESREESLESVWAEVPKLVFAYARHLIAAEVVSGCPIYA
tara:strand:- start:443 stop:673 length:231 start_codon:yes stop_codon:yes gene_type:complete